MARRPGSLIQRRWRIPGSVLVLCAAAALLPPTAEPRAARSLAAPPGNAYFRPVVVDGMTFPVARAPWLPVIGVRDDWRDPRFRLVDGRWRLVGYHEGNDVMAEEGTPVVALIGGRVERVGWTFYSGTRVGIRGTDGRYYFYAHLSEVAPGVTVGGSVQTGEWIGRVGNTGYGPPGERDRFPPHLHVGIQEGGAWVDPYPLVRRLYEASARSTGQAERRLVRLARDGDVEGWERVAANLYADRQEYPGSASG